MDILCYGVPSPKVFHDYIQFEEKRSGCFVSNIDFRNKSKGWGNNYTSIQYANGKEKLIKSSENEWYNIFLSHNTTRLSCFQCQYTNLQRYSDITVGDFWGYEKYKTIQRSNKGISKILINTEKGWLLWKIAEEFCETWNMPEESAIRSNLQHPPAKPALRNISFCINDKLGIKWLARVSRQRLLSQGTNRIVDAARKIRKGYR